MKRIILTALLLALAMPTIAQAQGKPAAYAAGKKVLKAEDLDENGNPRIVYIKLNSVTVPVITSRGLMQQVSVLPVIEASVLFEDDIANRKLRLTDAYIQELYGAVGSGAALFDNGIINVNEVKRRLKETTARVLGPDIQFNDVLLQVVQQSPR